jgi:integrase
VATDAWVLRRDPVDEYTVFWHFTDAKGQTVWPFLDYIIALVDGQQLNFKTVEGRAYALAKWYRYLAQERIDALDGDDSVLRTFRNAMLEREAANRSGNAQARRRTINLDMRNIYMYYAWLQQDPFYGRRRQLLGAQGCQITSTLLESQPAAVGGQRRYPLIFRQAGERSKHRLNFVPGEAHRAELTDYFYDRFSPELARRNCLLFALAWHIGWRRGSILSLTVDDFSPDQWNGEQPLDVQPSAQKFGYSNTFSVPEAVVHDVRAYLATERGALVARTGSHSRAIFLNGRTGQPLTGHAVSMLFSRARVALGWPKGAGLHAWRRGFTNAYVEREIDARLELGLDTGGEAIAMSVAHALGQQSLASQAAYIRDAQRRLRGSVTFRDKEEHARLADENAQLRAHIASLTKKIAGNL